MPEEAKANIMALVDNVLDPARERYGTGIHVNSGYRTEAYNKRVGGTPGSQHCCKGGSAAADICAVHSDYGCMMDWKVANLEIAKAIVKGGKWDQMILYVDGNGSLAPRFVHVSWKRNGGNRKQILKKTATGYSAVSAREILQGSLAGSPTTPTPSCP